MKDIFTPLTIEEMDQLDHFLLYRIDHEVYSEDKDEGIIDVSELDGFFTAIVSGPTVIPPSQWISSIWGNFEPEWENESDFENIFSLFMRHMNGIASTLMEQPQEFEPIFLERVVDDKTYTIVDEWCEGYMRGVELAAEQWRLDEIEINGLLGPIKAFNGEQAINTHHSFSEREIKYLQNAILTNVREIHKYWLLQREDSPALSPIHHSEPRVGRNDPCPCGSGKKYKKCCLH